MSTKQHITIGEAGSSYYADLFIDPAKLQKATQDKDVRNLEKEKALFEALIEKYGAVPRREEIKSEENTTACRMWHKNGRLRRESYHQDGKSHDPTDGTAAIRYWDEDGTLEYLARYDQGKLVEEITDMVKLATIQKNDDLRQIEKAFGGKLIVNNPAPS